MAFQPIGDRSRRVVIAELAAAAEVGEVITFTQLGEALDLDAEDAQERATIRQSVTAARKTLLQDHSRALVAVRGSGYRVAAQGEMAGIAEGHRDRATVQMTKALDVITYADESQMSPAELQRHRAVGIAIRNLHHRVTSAEDRLADLEQAVFGPPRRFHDGHTVIELEQAVFGHEVIEGEVAEQVVASEA